MFKEELQQKLKELIESKGIECLPSLAIELIEELEKFFNFNNEDEEFIFRNLVTCHVNDNDTDFIKFYVLNYLYLENFSNIPPDSYKKSIRELLNRGLIEKLQFRNHNSNKTEYAIRASKDYFTRLYNLAKSKIESLSSNNN